MIRQRRGLSGTLPPLPVSPAPGGYERLNLFWHYPHYGNQGGDTSKFPVPDPRYNAAKEQARRHQLEHELMPELEARHAAYLDPDWQPNADWWGSQIVAD